jgi:predicted transcriptional regulator
MNDQGQDNKETEIPEDEFDYHLQVLADNGIIEITKNGMIRMTDKARKKGIKTLMEITEEIVEYQKELLKDTDEYPLRKEFVDSIDKERNE